MYSNYYHNLSSSHSSGVVMDIRHTATICPYCGCGCGLTLETEEERIQRAVPTPASPVNRGKLCIKGWNVHEFIQHPDRLTRPLLRTARGWTPLDWESALEHAAGELKRIRDDTGPESLAVLTSARCTNEENYLLQKLTRCAIGSNNIDHCARL